MRGNGFENPVICPISAKAGLLAKMSLSDKSGRQNNRELFCLEDKFDEMDLEKFYNKYFPKVTIKDKSNDEEQLLKTCGIAYVETIINNYINEYRMKKSEKSQTKNKDKRALTITFIGNTGSGKSVLINSMLQRKLLPSENKAGTKTIIEISNEEVAGYGYNAAIYDDKDKLLKKFQDITYQTLCSLNRDKDVYKAYKIKINGEIPFINNPDIKVKLVDTIGYNKHKYISETQIRDIIDNSMGGLVIYFLDTTQPDQEDDKVLAYISKQIRKKGKAAEKRFLFIANKMDLFNPEDVAYFLLSLKRKLEDYGIRNAQIFPCSAYMSLCTRTYFKDIDVRNMTTGQKESLPLPAMYALPYIDKFINHKSLHLEDYTILPEYARKEINDKLISNGDINEQALVHFGIYSLEAAVNDFIKSDIAERPVGGMVSAINVIGGMLSGKSTLVNALLQNIKNTDIMLVDSPGLDEVYKCKNKIYNAINNGSNSLVLYVLDGTQLSTNDNALLLRYIAKQIKKGGRQVRNRFLFVINKMDAFNPEEEDIGEAILSAKRYLACHGIEDPQIFPCSAHTALNIRTYFNDINIDNLSRAQQKQLPPAARYTLLMIDEFIDYETMHLERYSPLPPSELGYRLKQAEDNNDTKEQALIHCGIYSIEAAITAYVKQLF